MSKKLLWILIGVMATALTGLVLVQAYWIKSAIILQRQQFGNLVNDALINVVYRFEAEETIFHITNEITASYESDTVFWSEGRTVKKSDLQNGSQTDFNISIGGSYDKFNKKKDFYVMADDTLLFYKSDPILPSEQIQSKNNALEVKEKLSAISDPNEKQEFIERIMTRMVSVNTLIEEHINGKLLNKLVKSELKRRGIIIPFEFAISNASQGIIAQSSNFNPNSLDPVYSTSLNDYIGEPNYLSIQFENEKSELRASLNLMTYSSIALTLMVIIIFAITMLVIFRQKKMSEIRVDFVNNMTHEFKTPISTISLASQMLKDDSIPDEMKNVGSIAKIIEDESKRLLVQVEKVLQTAVFEKGKLKLKQRDLDVHGLLTKVVQNFSIHVQKKNGSITTQFNAQHTTIHADELHLTNIMVNLLDNAMKYTKIVPEIIIETRDKRNALEVIIQDNGVGIAGENLKRIFDQFYRVSTGNRHDVKGFGLGLSYVKKIVDAHGGVIKVESELNKGTTFKILLPRDDEQS